TLRIYHDDLDAEEVTRLLGIEPSQAQIRGRAFTRSTGKEFIPPIGGWFLSTKGVTASRDARRHVDWILDRLAGKGEAWRLLRQQGHRIDMVRNRLRADGHNGPSISPTTISSRTEASSSSTCERERTGRRGWGQVIEGSGPYEFRRRLRQNCARPV